MKTLLSLGLLVIVSACSCPKTIQDYGELQTQLEYVDDIVIGNFPAPLPDTLQWSSVMSYLEINEPETFAMFEDYQFEILIASDTYLLIVRDPCDCHIVMYDFSCTDGRVDGPLYKSTTNASFRDISLPPCAEGIEFLPNLK